MRKFLVNVNGASYEVMVEEISGAAAPAAPVAASSFVAAPAAAPAPAAAAPAPKPIAAAAGQTSVSAPMPGTILSVSVKPGDAVKKNQVLMVLEAMKMENEIVAPAEGVVVAVNVAGGQAVNTGEPLCVIG